MHTPAKILRFPTPAQAQITDLLSDWVASRAADGHRQRGIDRYRDQVRQFAEWSRASLGDGSLGALRVEHIEAYKAAMMRRCSARSVCNALSALSAFCVWLGRRRLMSGDPTLDVVRPRTEEEAPEPLPKEELARLVKVISERPALGRKAWRRARLAIMIMLHAGLRIQEAAGLLWSAVDLEARTIRVSSATAKRGRSRVVYISDELAAELASWPRNPDHAVIPVIRQNRGVPVGKPMTPKSLAHVFERWLTSKGLKVHAHQLRHAFALRLLEMGVNLRIIQLLLGHKSLDTTAQYLRISNADARQAVLPLSYPAG
ncbi:MAG TPA: tyrosine-type recombinase/integrase [Roseiflexaceae bacterium]|nr:tyrosine-type recombinase/integrase [Roseiflexaceae bacterium]